MKERTFKAWAVTVTDGALRTQVVTLTAGLAALQKFVGGNVEIVHPNRHVGGWVGLILVCNEMPNRAELLPLQTPFLAYPLYGNFFLCRDGFQSLTKEDIAALKATPLGKLAEVEPMPFVGGTPKQIEEMKSLARQVRMTTQSWRKKNGPLDTLLKRIGEL